jgi:hypothetical protein
MGWPAASKGTTRESLAQTGNQFAAELCAKKAILNQSTNFGACGLIFAQASRITTLAQQSEKEVRLGDNKIRISGAWRADVIGFGAWDPPCRGFGIAKIRRTWQFQSQQSCSSGGYSVKIDHQTEAG